MTGSHTRDRSKKDGAVRPHPAEVALAATRRLRPAVDGLLRAISYAAAGQDLSRLRTGDAVLRAANIDANIGLITIDYCHGDRQDAIKRYETVRLELHAEAGRLRGAMWEYGRVGDAAACEVRRMLHAIPPARTLLPPMRETSYGTAAPAAAARQGTKAQAQSPAAAAHRPRRRPA